MKMPLDGWSLTIPDVRRTSFRRSAVVRRNGAMDMTILAFEESTNSYLLSAMRFDGEWRAVSEIHNADEFLAHLVSLIPPDLRAQQCAMAMTYDPANDEEIPF